MAYSTHTGLMFESSARAVRVTALGLLLLGSLPVILSSKIPPDPTSPNPQHHTTSPDAAAQTAAGVTKGDILDNVYTQWSEWGRCSSKCQQSRVRRCADKNKCGGSWLKDKRTCYSKRTCSSRSFKLLGVRKSDKLMEEILYKLLYGPWTAWSPCSRRCRKRRVRKCILPAMCGASYIQEEKLCKKTRSLCKKQYTLNTKISHKAFMASETGGSDAKSKHKKPQRTNDTRTVNAPEDRLKSNSPTLKNLTYTCGQRPSVKMARIVGGREAQKHSWPWQVAILERWKDQFCGGTLIAPQWVLSAAHCVRKKKRKRKVFVRVGEHDIYGYDKGEEILKLAKDFPHPQYDPETITNDIALLKLERPVNASENIGFACLPEEDDKLPEHTACRIVGWGKEKNTHVYGSAVLQEAEVPLVNRRRCQKVFDYAIHDTQVCAGYKQGGLDSCAGDSGGPLLCPKTVNGDTRWMVYGVTSYGEGCGEKGKFGIYTKVRKYIEWINDVIATH